MRRLVAAMAACAGLIVGVAPVAAHTKVFPTTVNLEGWGIDSNVHFWATGHLASPHAKCMGRRTVKLFFNSGATRTLIDVDLSSLNGEWAVKGKADSRPDSFTIKATRKRIDRSLGNRHRHICGGDERTTAVPPPMNARVGR